MTDPFAYMRGFRRPSPSSEAGAAVIAEHLDNRANEQEKALRFIKKGLKDYDRVQVIAASGFGKTYLAHRLIVDAARSNRQFLAVVVAPWVELIDQTKKRSAEYFSQGGLNASLYDLVVVCSDKEAKSPFGDFERVSLAELESRLKSGEHRRTIVLTTNASVGKVGAVLDRHGPADLTIVDEAHHAAGSIGRKVVRDIHALSSRKTVYMTATQRQVSKRIDGRRSMDDAEAFGPIAYQLTFGEAARQKIISESVLALLGVEDDEAASLFQNLADEGFRFKGTDQAHYKYEVAAAVVTVRAMSEGKLQRILTFHNTKIAAKEFSALMRAVASALGITDLGFGAIVEDTANRREIIDSLVGLNDNGTPVKGYALSSCRVLSEGFDLPSVDGVVVVDPRLSEIDVAQTINRGSRFDKAKPGKKNVVIIPVLGDNPYPPDNRDNRFNSVQRIVDLMRDVDAEVVGTLYSLASERQPQDPDAPMRTAPKVVTNLSVDVVRRVSLQLVDPGITSWMEQYEELKALGRLPAGHGPLGNWAQMQRTKGARGDLRSDRRSLLDALPFWVWRFDKDRDWAAAYERLQVLGTLPSFRTDASLLSWAQKQRSLFRGGHLPPWRVARLEGLPFWTWENPASSGRTIQQRYDPSLTLSQMAALCGCTKGTVRDHLSRAGLPWQSGRPRGGAHHRARFSDSQIRRVVQLAKRGDLSSVDIAAATGVSQEAVKRVISGKNWTHLSGGVIKEHPRPSAPKLTPAQVEEVVLLRRGGAAIGAISSQFGVSSNNISSICSGRTRRDITGLAPGEKIVPNKENH